MKNQENPELKEQVREFWDNETCGTFLTDKDKFTKEYFEDIERTRYKMQPEIHDFAEFEKAKNKKVLEIGVGAGTDFLQWVRNGANAYGLDLTQQAIEHVRHRLSLYDLQAKEFKVGDAENLPFESNEFDIVYSWGVIHHTPDTPKAFREIVRVLKPGGKAKIMIYHRRSILAYLFWIKHALLKGKISLSIADVLWENMESIGTKAYTKNEVKEILKDQPLNSLKIMTVLTYYDKLLRFNKLMQFSAKALAALLGGNKAGWFMLIEFEKKL
jgi:ubiquinone/menaquinone biosynthesis C-methylase UbiE